MFPGKLATTPALSVPTASLVGAPASVATPLLSVTATPAKAPSSVKLIIAPAMPWPDPGEVRVALSVAAPPEVAVPETLLILEPACGIVGFGGKPSYANAPLTGPFDPNTPSVPS